MRSSFLDVVDVRHNLILLFNWNFKKGLSMIKFLNYFLLSSILLSQMESANAVGNKLLLEGFEVFRKSIGRTVNPGRVTQKNFNSFQKTFFGTANQIERGEMTEKTKNKKLQIVDFGKKDYKFDPKTSMYYYEDKGSKELKGVKQPESKEFDTFFEFDVKKK